MKLAKAAGIDGFVLNIAPPWAGAIGKQIATAFAAANDLDSGFKLFFSFDYLGGGAAWDKDDVIEILKAYGSNSAHYQYNGKPYVSTFEGTQNINDWPTIRASVPGGITFVPDWTSLGPSGFATHLDIVDGAFSWDMWPAGPSSITDNNDKAWKSAINGKLYMMGVSPWFYTKLPGYNKEWVWRGDEMWHDCWQQVLDVEPQIVQIVSWNDYAESHYIGPIFEAGVPDGSDTNAHPYVDGMAHDNWLDLLPHYIGRFKAGGDVPQVETEKLQYWYRLTPAAAGSSDGVTGGPCTDGSTKCYDPNTIVQDKVFVTALVNAPATVSIQIGNNSPKTFQATSAGANHFSQPFNGQTGNVTFQIVRNKKVSVEGTGEAILASPQDGVTNYNAWVGGASA